MQIKIKHILMAIVMIMLIIALSNLPSILYWKEQKNYQTILNDKIDTLEIDIKANQALIENAGQYFKIIEEFSKRTKDKMDIEDIIQCSKIIFEQCIIHEDEGLQPAIIFAVIQQESDFNPFAISNKKAYGIMQLIQTTATPYMLNMDIYWSRENILDPIVNLRVGIKHLLDVHEMWVAEGLEKRNQWHLTYHTYFWGEKNTRMLLSAKSRINVPGFRYPAEVQLKQKQWEAKGL